MNFLLVALSLKKFGDNIIIDRIEKNSPAYKNGIRRGDKLISINDDSSGDITIYRNFLRKENSEVSLIVVNSKGEIKKVKLKIKRLL